MCPYIQNGCKAQGKYSGTDLCTVNYYGCAIYMAATVRGVNNLPDTMTAIDYARLQKGA
jgi:hypothetical protein